MNNPTKFASSHLYAGTQGTGKSTLVEKVIEVSPLPNALIYLEDIDCYGTAFSKYPLINFWDYKGGKVRINANDIEYNVFMAQVGKYFRNGNLVIDEGGMYERIQLSEHIIPVVKRQRKTNVEVHLLYHGVSELPLSSFKFVKTVTLFHQQEEFSRKKNSVPRMEELIAAQRRISQKYFAGNRFYNETIQLS